MISSHMIKATNEIDYLILSCGTVEAALLPVQGLKAGAILDKLPKDSVRRICWIRKSMSYLTMKDLWLTPPHIKILVQVKFLH